MNPAKFLYFKKGSADFIAFLDNEVSALAASYDESTLLSSKNEFSTSVKKQLNTIYSDFGVEVYNLGMYGGIIFDNPAIQQAIDDRLIQQNKLLAVQQEVKVAEERKKLIPYESQWADINLKKAMANYIDKAGDKGIVLVPSTTVGNSAGIMLTLPSTK